MRNMEQYFDLLLKIPLFSGVGRETLSSLLGCLQAKVSQIARGMPVFLEGEEAGFVGVVLEGDVRIVREDYYGNSTLLGQIGPGEIFAEAYACAEVSTMPVSGYAWQDSKVLMLSCRKMLTICSNACPFHNQLVKNLLKVVAQNNLSLNRKIRFMSHKTTRQKLMAYLSDQAKQKGGPEFHIPFDRQSLADYLGVERSAMSAELSKLKKDGFLETRGAWFRLLEQEWDPDEKE